MMQAISVARRAAILPRRRARIFHASISTETGRTNRQQRSENHRNYNNNERSHQLMPSITSMTNSPLDWITWPFAKIPRGFQDFFPKDDYEPPSSSSDGKKSAESSTDKKVDDDTTNSDSERLSSKDNSSEGGDEKKRQAPPPPPPPNDDANNNFPGLLAMLALVLTLRQYSDQQEREQGTEISYQDFRQRLKAGQVAKLQVVNQKIAKVILKPGATATTMESSTPVGGATMAGVTGANANGIGGGAAVQEHSFFYIGSVEALEEKLRKDQANVHPQNWVEVQYLQQTNWAVEMLKILPLAAFGAAIYFGSRGVVGAAGGQGGGPGGIFGIGKSNAKKIKPEDVNVNFGHVAGCKQAKEEIMEFVEFLKDSKRFTKLGAKIPKGALLCGPPGTGKTLLAKAVAGEAGVPFFSISGSDFIEMFVGVGPSRVRDLFKEAREKTPCIIFIDEIDAVGRQRGKGGFSGGNDERENTLNQLLVEMDGFTPTTGVIVLAGTNRVDILDQALTRPGRFDRQIQVDLPDLQGRREIFHVHLKGITLEGEPDEFAGRLAGLTPGFAGADIANLCNEAAIVAARRKAEAVAVDDFEKATDRIIGGLESNKIMSDEERSIVAHHEAGHAVAGWFLEHADPLLKVTIIPRASGALGFAQYLPKEVFLRSQDQIMDIVCMALAGRAAEQIFFGRVTTGASDDLRRVTQLVYSTIKNYGMNERVGQLSFPDDDNAGPGDKRYSDSTAEAMDDEARAIVDAAYQRTIDLIAERKDQVQKVAEMLLNKETITHDDVADLIGPRPFEGDGVYQEYVSASKRETDGEEESKEKDVGENAGFQGPLTPGLA